MKINSTILCLVAWICSMPLFLSAQTECKGSFTEHYLNANNIRASFFARGNKFYNEGRPLFFAPYSTEHPVSSIFASTPWIGGFDDAGNFKMAGETYPNAANTDYRVGPLTSIGTPYDSICQYFDKVWNVYAEEIQKHLNDFLVDGIIDDTIASIFAWPGYKNPYSLIFNGFEFPADNGTPHLAPFFDNNGDEIYNPDKGDFPIPFPHSSDLIIPDQMMWMVFNDAAEHEVTKADPLRVEIQLTAYAFHCLDNEILNNTIFNSYKIINRAVSALDSVYFGLWTDYDLGCASDDYMGVDSAHQTEFVYNANPIDGEDIFDCSSGVTTYGSKPPVQSMTYLNYPMNSFITYNSTQIVGREMYNALNGVWLDESPMTAEGNGNVPGSTAPTTKFLFSGDPRDTTSWAAINEVNGMDFKTVSSVSLGRFDPGQQKRVEVAYMYHFNPDKDHLGQITTMQQNIDQLLATIDHLDDTCLESLSCPNEDDCVWPGDFNHDGIADHFDLLQWGVMNESTGESRTPRVNWRGYAANNWAEETIDGLNYKHGDASGNGEVNFFDLDVNLINHLSTTPGYQKTSMYPPGPDLVLSSNPMTSTGEIRMVRVTTGTQINNVLGIAFEMEFDTTIFEFNSRFLIQWPVTTNSIGYFDGLYEYSGPLFSYENSYGFVQTDHQAINVDSGSILLRMLSGGLTLKPGLTLDDVPDSTVIRLRNLIAIDPEGNDLQIGSNTLVVYKEGVTAVTDPTVHEINIYPNPANEHIYIDVPDQTKVEIYNVQGKIMEVVLTDGQSIDVSDYMSGLYYLRFPTLGQVSKVVIH